MPTGFYPRPPLINRFLEKVAIGEGLFDCWIWQGGKSGPGYGLIWRDGRLQMAHRVSYELFKGPIPDGYEIDHLCRVKACVRPEHLEAVTPSENQLRTVPFRKSWADRPCHRGHPRTPENTYIRPDGFRACRPCQRMVHRGRSRRRQAA